MTKFERCILVCFVELLVILFCMTEVFAMELRHVGAAICVLITLVVSLTLVIVFASLRSKKKDAEK